MSPVVRGALLLAVGGLVTVACSGDDDAAPSSTTTTIAPTTSASSTSTSTTATITTATTTTSPTTTAPRTVEEEVIAAYQAAYDAFWAASQNPNDPELRRQLDAARTGEDLRLATELLDRYVIGDRRVVPNPLADDGFVVFSVAIEGDRAVLSVCDVNPWILVEGVTATSVVDDGVVVSLVEDHMVLEDGVWKLTDSFLTEDLSEVGKCPQRVG